MKFAGQITLTAEEVLDALKIHAHKLGRERELVTNLTAHDFLTSSTAHVRGRMLQAETSDVQVTSVDVAWTR